MPSTRFIRSPNRSSRNGASIKFIVLHNTAGSMAGTLSWFQQTRSQVSAHYVVDRNADIVQMVEDEFNAWHAGNGLMNRESIGIEIVSGYSGINGMTAAQEQAVIRLVRGLMSKYRISAANVRPHRSITNTACPGAIWPRDSDFNNWKNRNL